MPHCSLAWAPIECDPAILENAHVVRGAPWQWPQHALSLWCHLLLGFCQCCFSKEKLSATIKRVPPHIASHVPFGSHACGRLSWDAQVFRILSWTWDQRMLFLVSSTRCHCFASFSSGVRSGAARLEVSTELQEPAGTRWLGGLRVPVLPFLSCNEN